MCMSAQMSEEPRGTGYPGDKVTGGCEQSNMGSGDPTQSSLRAVCAPSCRDIFQLWLYVRFETWSCCVTWLSGNHRVAHSNRPP